MLLIILVNSGSVISSVTASSVTAVDSTKRYGDFRSNVITNPVDSSLVSLLYLNDSTSTRRDEFSRFLRKFVNCSMLPLAPMVTFTTLYELLVAVETSVSFTVG